MHPAFDRHTPSPKDAFVRLVINLNIMCGSFLLSVLTIAVVPGDEPTKYFAGLLVMIGALATAILVLAAVRSRPIKAAPLKADSELTRLLSSPLPHRHRPAAAIEYRTKPSYAAFEGRTSAECDSADHLRCPGFDCACPHHDRPLPPGAASSDHHALSWDTRNGLHGSLCCTQGPPHLFDLLPDTVHAIVVSNHEVSVGPRDPIPHGGHLLYTITTVGHTVTDVIDHRPLSKQERREWKAGGRPTESP